MASSWPNPGPNWTPPRDPEEDLAAAGRRRQQTPTNRPKGPWAIALLPHSAGLRANSAQRHHPQVQTSPRRESPARSRPQTQTASRQRRK
eukprot:14555439-Alexandrium_andersonii.AAC.1